MDQPQYFAFYGSLRRGMSLYERFKDHLQYHSTVWLSGFELYALESYPFAIKSNNPAARIKVDIFKIAHTETRQEIENIELDAGYYVDSVLVNGLTATIYLFENVTKDRKVLSGDWVEFFGR